MSTNLPGPGEQPEYLGEGTAPADQPRPSRGRRTGLLAAAGLAVVAVVGVGGWGLAQLMSSGESPAAALPATTAGYMAVDLDPSAGQKIEAIKMLKKFPGIAEELDVDSRDDLRRYFFEKLQESDPCKGFDYAKDVEPWIGERMAVAAVPDGDEAVPVVALAADDEEAAKAAVKKLDECSDSDEPTGTAYAGGYLLVSDTQKHADFVAAGTEKGTLADDEDFQTWMDRAGDAGVITGYASAEAPKLMKSLQDEMGAPAMGMDEQKVLDQALKAYENFEGGAMVVRFEDGALETEVVAKGLDGGIEAAKGVSGPSLATLPKGTGAALTLGLQDGWLTKSLEQFEGMMGGAASLDEVMAQGEAATGLQLPEDVETLLGDGVSISVDGSLDVEALSSGAPDPSTMPVALRIKGDPGQITPIIDKLKALAGPQAGLVQVKTGDGQVVVGVSQAYVDEVSGDGGLGDVESFQRAVPEADRSAGGLFVNFDAGDGWAEKIADLASGGNADARANVAPLDALGLSGWIDDDGVQHGLLVLTTD